MRGSNSSELPLTLLTEKLKAYATRDRITDNFATHQAEFTRARLQQIVVAREDLSRELVMQISKGANFADLARQHSSMQKRMEANTEFCCGGSCRGRLPGQSSRPERAI